MSRLSWLRRKLSTWQTDQDADGNSIDKLLRLLGSDNGILIQDGPISEPTKRNPNTNFGKDEFITMLRRHTEITNNSNYNAFPGVELLDDNSLIVVYRQGIGHAGDVGSIVMKTSTDLGITWSSEITVYSEATYDSRDLEITQLSNGTLIVSFFKEETSGPTGKGAYVIKSTDGGDTWGTPVEIGLSWGGNWEGSCTAPVQKTDSGNLLLPVCGHVNSEDSNRSCKLAKSTDEGDTWTDEGVIADGPANSSDFNEAVLEILENGNWLVMVRGSSNFWQVKSTDNGSTWSAATSKFSAAGRPRIQQLSDGSLVCAYRSSISGGSELATRTSVDNGLNWTSDAFENILDKYPAQAMMYASIAEISDNFCALVYGAEVSSSESDIRIKYATTGSGLAPTGEIIGQGVTSRGGDLQVWNGAFSLYSSQHDLRTKISLTGSSAYLKLWNDNGKLEYQLGPGSTTKGIPQTLPSPATSDYSTTVTTYDAIFAWQTLFKLENYTQARLLADIEAGSGETLYVRLTVYNETDTWQTILGSEVTGTDGFVKTGSGWNDLPSLSETYNLITYEVKTDSGISSNLRVASSIQLR